MNVDDLLQQLILVDGHLYTQKQLYDEVISVVNTHTTPLNGSHKFMSDDGGGGGGYRSLGHMFPRISKCFRCCCCCPLLCLRNYYLRGFFKLVAYIFLVLCFIAFLVYLSRKATM